MEFVIAGRVAVNGRDVLDPGFKPWPNDAITVDGKPLTAAKKIYLLFNKPGGYVTTRSDELGRPTVYDLLKDIDTWVSPVGRLDLETEGLLVFTNDTTFGNILTEPRFMIPRTYEVTIDGALTKDEIDSMGRGIDIGRGEISRPTAITALKSEPDTQCLRVTLTEGKNREIRRLFESFNRPVVRLVRISYGPFELGTLQAGKHKIADSHGVQAVLNRIERGRHV